MQTQYSVWLGWYDGILYIYMEKAKSHIQLNTKCYIHHTKYERERKRNEKNKVVYTSITGYQSQFHFEFSFLTVVVVVVSIFILILLLFRKNIFLLPPSTLRALNVEWKSFFLFIFFFIRANSPEKLFQTFILTHFEEKFFLYI